MAQDYNNLLRKDVIDKMAQERQENSLKLAMMRGKQHIWRPDKFTLTKYGPKIKFNWYKFILIIELQLLF